MMPSCLSILFRALRIEWRETKRTLLPTTPIETGLFLFFFLLYGCIGYRMLFHTELIDVPNGGAGSYLGYDNLFHLHTRGGAFDISHPFFGIFNPVDNPVQRENFRYYLPDTDEPVDNRRTGPDLSLPEADRPDLFPAGTVTDRVHGMLFHDRCLIIHHRILSVLLFPARLLTINAFQGIHADRIYKRPDAPLSLFPLWRNNNHQRSQTDNGPVPE